MAEKKSLGLRIGILLAAAGIAVIVSLSIFVWLPPCDGINNEFLGCLWKGSFGDWAGLILFYASCLFLGGGYGFFNIDDDEDPWRVLTKVAWGAGIGGIALILLA